MIEMWAATPLAALPRKMDEGDETRNQPFLSDAMCLVAFGRSNDSPRGRQQGVRWCTQGHCARQYIARHRPRRNRVDCGTLWIGKIHSTESDRHAGSPYQGLHPPWWTRT